MLRFPEGQDEQTELTELTVIIVDSKVQLITPELKRLKPEVLKDVATAMGGSIEFLKVRAHYELLESQHCTYRDCWRPAVDNSYRCDSHPMGM